MRMQTAVTWLDHTSVNAEVDFLEMETFVQVTCHFIKTMIILIIFIIP